MQEHCYMKLIQQSNPVGDNNNEITLPLLLLPVILFENNFENKYEVIGRS